MTTASAPGGSIPPVWIKAHCPVPSSNAGASPIGTSPMILENAAIAQFLKPMVISLAFGVLICMPATLILTPAFYMIGIDFKRIFGFIV